MIRLVFLALLLWAGPAWADQLGCFEPSQIVSGAAVQFPGTATSVTANVMDPNDTTTPTAEPTMSAVGSGATNLWRATNFSIPASPTFGIWTIQYEGTVNSQTVWGADTFEVAATCPLRPVVAGRTLSVNASGRAGINADDMNGTLSDAEIETVGVNVILVEGASLGPHVAGQFPSDDRSLLGTAYATPDAAGHPKVTIKDGTGPGEIDTLAGAIVNADSVDQVTGAVGSVTTPVSLATADKAQLGYHGTVTISSINVWANISGTDYGNQVTITQSGFITADGHYANYLLRCGGIDYSIETTVASTNTFRLRVSKLIPTATTGTCEVRATP